MQYSESTKEMMGHGAGQNLGQNMDQVERYPENSRSSELTKEESSSQISNERSEINSEHSEVLISSKYLIVETSSYLWRYKSFVKKTIEEFCQVRGNFSEENL